ncbi:hypothetical protein ACOZB2_23595 [Pantoea endophytica]|uniref:ApeA N-terminal domain-containing protein n=1 Tax=Pantoea sp. BJ2 TaxID=3141322 RepID=A0AAU7TUC3_9GAMM
MGKVTFEAESVSFISTTQRLDSVECDITVEEESTWKEITITTRNKLAADLRNWDSFTVEIMGNFNASKTYKKIEMLDTVVGNYSISFINTGGKIQFTVHPRNVIKRHFFNENDSTLSNHIDFFINDAPIIAPRISPSFDSNGNVNQRKQKPISITLPNGNKILSDVNFSYTSEGNKFESIRHQVLKAKTNKKHNVIETINQNLLPEVDNLLLLTSLAHGERVMCRGWTCYKNNCIIQYFRCNQVETDDIPNSVFREIVTRTEINRFLNEASLVYNDSEYSAAIKNSINSLMYTKGMVLEMTFLAYFQALESLTLTFRRINNIEHTLDPSTFKKLRTIIEKQLNTDIVPDKEKRALIKSKIMELNRPSLQDTTLIFFDELKVEMSDLWPLFDKKDAIGLSTLRNKIIHGDILPKNIFSHLILASEHLRILLNRVLFCLLKWDLLSTNISPQKLKLMNGYFDTERLESSLKLTSEALGKKLNHSG